MEAKEVGESVLYPLSERLGLGWTGEEVAVWQVLLGADAEVAVDGATAHGARLELGETRGTDTRVSARQQCPREGEILTNYTELLASGTPQRAGVVH